MQILIRFVIQMSSVFFRLLTARLGTFYRLTSFLFACSDPSCGKRAFQGRR